MTDVSFACEAKSDQLNAVDIMGADRVIKIRDVKVKKGDSQPISVFFDGDNNRPWTPSKGMIRILAGAWGVDSSQWVGKYVQLHFEPSVKYAGKEVGGIRIAGMSDLKSDVLHFSLAINKTQRIPYPVPRITVEQSFYPDDKFTKALPKMIQMMQSGEFTLQGIIAQCQKTGQLTQEQIELLEQNEPQQVSESDDEI
jgi:hypothetical protein